jgi:lipid-binding SYLF domain-containing protein
MFNLMETAMQKRKFLIQSAALLGAGAGTLLLSGCTTTTPGAGTASKRQAIDADVNAALGRLSSTVPGSRELLGKARGVLVFPSVLAAGLGIGGEYGEGALRIGGRSVDYYSTVSASFGWQIGAQSKAVIFLFMTQDALDKFRNSEGWTAGVDASVAVVKTGANGDVDLNTAMQPVNVFVMTNKGLMANLTIEGTKITKLKTS